MTKPFLLAQISDLHIGASAELSFGTLDTAGMLRACVRDILALPQPPDAIAITGDLTDSGRPQEYALLRELLEPLPMPLYMVPGNHDERDALRAAFPDHTYLRGSSPFIQYAIEAYPVRIVALDTLIRGSGGGELCEERLSWLERTLAQAPEKPTVILMHHPPFTTFIRYMDECGLRNPQALAAVVERHRQVEVVLCGHVHRPIEVRFAGTRASTAPSTAHQVQLDLDTRAPLALVMEPPAYRLHVYTPVTGLVSHTAYVGDFATHRIVG